MLAAAAPDKPRDIGSGGAAACATDAGRLEITRVLQHAQAQRDISIRLSDHDIHAEASA